MPSIAFQALAEFDDGLVPAFIIETLGDLRFTVFVSSVYRGSPAIPEA